MLIIWLLFRCPKAAAITLSLARWILPGNNCEALLLLILQLTTSWHILRAKTCLNMRTWNHKTFILCTKLVTKPENSLNFYSQTLIPNRNSIIIWTSLSQRTSKIPSPMRGRVRKTKADMGDVIRDTTSWTTSWAILVRFLLPYLFTRNRSTSRTFLGCPFRIS